ncbi:T-complex protein 11-domain-containing protein [Halteromyces radiatus]|uniref:T-complex protein 11-domain-containing protein n=1 Tax=Halteromyces radiatus TaxID=101107 RepID=UPI00222038AD|nr:T-complex protein 11-domain-containing protein [Halteromyces radiatus]KAI8089130.1 T-complex protein 11-domain-containing protein [Halteromyces radiatus]
MTPPFYYTVNVDCLCQTSRRPFHLDLRFPPTIDTTLTRQVEQKAQVKRDSLLTQRRFKLHQRFLQVQRTVQQVKARREQQAILFLQSLENAERNRIDQLEQRRIINKQLVDRAKSIAHQHRSQSKAESERRRLELEQRLEASEIRRLNYLGLSKPTGMNSPSTSSSARPSASSDNHKQRPSLASLLHSYHHLGLPVYSQHTSWLDFQALSHLIRQQDVISIVGKLLTFVLDKDTVKRNNKARIFLSAYMMTMCPNDILQSIPDENVLVEAAHRLLSNFETWVEQPSKRVTKLALAEAWYHYSNLFEQWKCKDRDQLLTSMMAYYLELMSVQRTLQQDNEDGRDIDDLLSQQMRQLKLKIKRLGGKQALASLKDQMLTPQPEEGIQEQEGQQQTMDLDELYHLTKDLPQLPHLTNAQLAHELILDPDFQLQQHSSSPLEDRVRTMARRAYFDSLLIDLDHQQYQSTLLLLHDIRKKLLCMVEKGQTAYDMLEQMMDMGLIEQQMQHGSFDLSHLVTTLIECMRHLCAPIRDEAVNALSNKNNDNNNKAVVEILEDMLPLLDDMILDVANFKLRSLRPYLAPMAVAYEQANFKHTQLPNTRQWIQQAWTAWQNKQDQRNPEQIQQPRPSIQTLFHDAMLTWFTSSNPAVTPETWQMDLHRLNTYHRQTQHLITIASLLMITKKNKTADTLWTLFQQDLQPPSAQHVLAQLHVDNPVIKAMVHRILARNDPLYTLLARRVAAVLKSQWSHHTFVSDAVLTSSGLLALKSQLQHLASRTDVLLHHHFKVYGSWYSQCFDEIV